ncbi:two-component sensor histidine kinase [Photobacterium sanctipauli]|uniref:histidine kinase n=2 Tax=Photobacterium sanctipauli TaxID=1342794 RepID=A0A2T3NNR5_9GAMM|nr:HAMP domain-containing sensor histidine kinase [Photobacterium sanctipauli]PSW17286.1 two-component sensor histidine kinase [Photobacterium sanctipauli]
MDILITFNIYLAYGLAFFAIFFAILFQDLSKSRISIAEALPILALFGLIHGLHEWSELYFEIYQEEYRLTTALATFKVIKLWLSYIALGAFAWKMLEITRWPLVQWVKCVAMLVLAAFVISLVVRYGDQEYRTYLDVTANHIRWIFGLGAGVLSGMAMYSYANELEVEGHGASLPFKLTGIALISYGISAGVLMVELGLWVLFVRTLCAIGILVSLWYALRIFDRERNNQIEAALQQSLQDAKLKELGELTSAVSHEIKTPLSSAMMSCDLLEHHLPDNEVHQRQLGRIRYGLERAAEISQEVLNYAHHRPIERVDVTLAQVINSSVSLNQYRLEGFDLELSIDESLVISGDAGLLEEVFTNLLSNAIDACAESKKISISGYQNKLDAIVTIADSGTGISDELIEKAMKPFFTTKPKGEGTGMGLAIAKQIVMQHNGDIALHNNEHGLTVAVRIPRKMP